MAAPVTVAPSLPEGYRMRARLHVRGSRIGLFRDGTHDLCDARATRQLLPETCDVLDRVSDFPSGLPEALFNLAACMICAALSLEFIVVDSSTNRLFRLAFGLIPFSFDLVFIR